MSTSARAPVPECPSEWTTRSAKSMAELMGHPQPPRACRPADRLSQEATPATGRGEGTGLQQATLSTSFCTEAGLARPGADSRA